jgi:hypothetical protein
MTARNKLNDAYFNGCLLVAGLLGLVLRSLTIFVMALIALVIGNLCSGGIRPKHNH